MKIIRNSVVLLLTVILASNLFLAFARAGDDAEDILKHVEAKYASIHDAKVFFTEMIKYGVTESEQKFSGTLLMKKGNKYRIEMDDQTIVTDGVSVWSYTKSNRQVIVDHYKENSQSFSPDKVLVNVPSRYHSIVLGHEKIGEHETVILKLTPMDTKSNVQWMKVWVDRDDWMMRKIQALEISDNVTTYAIDSLTTNHGFADDRFQFHPPQGVEVIDLR